MRFFFVLLALTGVATADPVIDVHGRMRIELEHIERSNNGMVVSGTLLDEAQNEPMPGWTVALRIGALDEEGRESFVYGAAQPVDLDGAFRFVVSALGPHRYQIHLTAPGDTVFLAPSPIERELDLGRRPVELRLFAPPEHPADATTLPISLEAVALDRGPAASNAADSPYESDVAVDLELDGTPTATLVLKDGRAATSVPLSRAHPGQELVVHARFAGDATRGPAEASARVRLVESAALELFAEPTHVQLGGDVKLHGRLRFGSHAVGGLPVTVRPLGDESGTHTTAVATDYSGNFVATLRAPTQGTRAAYEALFTESEAKARSLPSARSVVVVVELVAGFSFVDLGARPAGGALVVAAALLITLALLRLGGVLAARPARRNKLVDARVIAKPGPQATWRTAGDRRIAGRVLDAEHGRAIDRARVEATVGDIVLAAHTARDGTFSLASEVDGVATIAIERSGFVTARLSGRVPHRGEWSVLDIRLVPLRAELLRRYGAALAAHVPQGESLGPRTPRELAELALRAHTRSPGRKRIDPAALRTLRAWIEVSCFGPVAPHAESLRHMDELAANLSPPA